jgi:hypothetical protein
MEDAVFSPGGVANCRDTRLPLILIVLIKSRIAKWEMEQEANGTEYAPPHYLVQLSCVSRNQDYVSKNFERWKELATLTSKEQDSAKLTELAKEMNLVLTEKTPYLDAPLRVPAEGSNEESQLDDVLEATAGGKVRFT